MQRILFKTVLTGTLIGFLSACTSTHSNSQKAAMQIEDANMLDTEAEIEVADNNETDSEEILDGATAFDDVDVASATEELDAETDVESSDWNDEYQ